jgi:AcrR family transcriptional regulator
MLAPVLGVMNKQTVLFLASRVPTRIIKPSLASGRTLGGVGAQAAAGKTPYRAPDGSFVINGLLSCGRAQPKDIQICIRGAATMASSARNPEIGRSPEVASPRERLIQSAGRLFCRFGINAVGVDAVVADAGTAKTTLYKNFASKEKLVEAVLEREGQDWRDWFIAGVNRAGGSPRERLSRVFPLLREWFAQERFYGCPFINAVGEHDKGDDRLRAITLRHKTVVLDHLEGLCREAGAADPHRMAHQIGLLIDGAIVAAMVTRDPGCADVADGIWASLLPAPVPQALEAV